MKKEPEGIVFGLMNDKERHEIAAKSKHELQVYKSGEWQDLDEVVLSAHLAYRVKPEHEPEPGDVVEIEDGNFRIYAGDGRYFSSLVDGDPWRMEQSNTIPAMWCHPAKPTEVISGPFTWEDDTPDTLEFKLDWSEGCPRFSLGSDYIYPTNNEWYGFIREDERYAFMRFGYSNNSRLGDQATHIAFTRIKEGE